MGWGTHPKGSYSHVIDSDLYLKCGEEAFAGFLSLGLTSLD